MQNIKRIMVALDLSTMDQQLLEYTRFIASVSEAEKIYFLHIIPNFTQPANVDLSFHKSFTVNSPIDEKVKAILSQQVDKVFRPVTAGAVSAGSTAPAPVMEPDIEIEVIEGMPSRQLLHWTEVKEIDLLIVGKKNKSEGSGITPRQVARKASCDVLFLTEGASTTPKKIAIPIDFSDNSARALQMALRFKQQLPDAELHAVHILSLLPKDYYFGLDQNADYRKYFQKEAEKACDQFFSQHELPKKQVELHFLQDDYNNTYRQLKDYTESNGFDCILIGAKGHSLFENFLYGSVTERLVDYVEHIPIMIVR
ncbi:MAG: universal stress protein [Bacteroidota bacterium]